MNRTRHFAGSFSSYLIPIVAWAVTTVLLLAVRPQVNSATIALCFLLVVLFAATSFGSRPALVVSVLASLSFNYFFLPPYHTLTISEPENWVSLFVFLAVAITVGQLSGHVRLRAIEAERLYAELQDAFEKASEAEGLRRSEKLKSALLDAVTHDLRTPLTSIKAATTMLIAEHEKDDIHRTLEPAGRGDLLDVINEETDNLNAFVESMVGLAKIEAGETGWEKGEMAVDEIIANALQRASRSTIDRHVIVSTADGVPAMNVDAKAVAEVLYNLIDNAVKYSPPGSAIQIDVVPAGDWVRFSVEDEGRGIPESERENVFHKFYRADKTAKGFGIGLAIVRGIIEAHNGRIWIEDGRKGSRFIFELPVDSKK